MNYGGQWSGPLPITIDENGNPTSEIKAGNHIGVVGNYHMVRDQLRYCGALKYTQASLDILVPFWQQLGLPAAQTNEYSTLFNFIQEQSCAYNLTVAELTNTNSKLLALDNQLSAEFAELANVAPHLGDDVLVDISSAFGNRFGSACLGGSNAYNIMDFLASPNANRAPYIDLFGRLQAGVGQVTPGSATVCNRQSPPGASQHPVSSNSLDPLDFRTWVKSPWGGYSPISVSACYAATSGPGCGGTWGGGDGGDDSDTSGGENGGAGGGEGGEGEPPPPEKTFEDMSIAELQQYIANAKRDLSTNASKADAAKAAISLLNSIMAILLINNEHASDYNRAGKAAESAVGFGTSVYKASVLSDIAEAEKVLEDKIRQAGVGGSKSCPVGGTAINPGINSSVIASPSGFGELGPSDSLWFCANCAVNPNAAGCDMYRKRLSCKYQPQAIPLEECVDSIVYDNPWMTQSAARAAQCSRMICENGSSASPMPNSPGSECGCASSNGGGGLPINNQCFILTCLADGTCPCI